MTDHTQAEVVPTRPETFAGATRAQMAEFRRVHGSDRVKALTVPLPGSSSLQVIMRAPERLEYERHSETLMKIRDNKVAQALQANRTLVLACTLAPEASELAAALDRYPALADKLAEPILNMAGADVEVREETF